MIAIRGAIFIDENTREDILDKTKQLINKIIEINTLDQDEIISILFSATSDLTKVYPAIGARELGIVHAGLFCTQEMYVENSSNMCLRIMMHVSSNTSQSEVKHVYLNGAQKLRPDIAEKIENQSKASIFSIAVDGPAGAGKSTIAKNIAKKLGITYIDTGAMYRAVGLYCKQNNISLEDTESIINHLDGINITIEHIDAHQHVFLNGEDVNELIRSNEASEAASLVSSIKEVRLKLVELQRGMALQKSVIMDGRDIGTHVLTGATLKIYLVASVEVRAERRYKESLEKGHAISLDVIKQDIIDRDYRDMNREASPLVQASDAVLVDTTDMDIDTVVNHIIKLFGDIYGDNCS